MFSTEQLLTYTRWSGYLTVFCAALAILGWLLKWGIRFRLVGITGFMAVLTGGIFALSLGLYNRPTIPGAMHFSRVFDTGGSELVITVPSDITEEQLRATMQQAAADLYSPGRLAQGTDKMTIRVRTVLHPQPGVSEPLYLGKIRRSLFSRKDESTEIEIFSKQLAKLPKSAA